MESTQKGTLGELLGPLAQFFLRLIGNDGAVWWDAFKRFLRRENPWIVWKYTLSIMVGSRTALGILIEFREQMITVDDWVKSYLEKNRDFPTNSEHGAKYFTDIALSELGFSRKLTTYQEVYNRAVERGLGFCTLEDVLLLCLKHSKGDYKNMKFIFAMNPIHHDSGYIPEIKILSLSWDEDGKVSLGSETSGVAWQYSPTDRLVFEIKDIQSI